MPPLLLVAAEELLFAPTVAPFFSLRLANAANSSSTKSSDSSASVYDDELDSD
eukprot:CAMPEP_0197004012 /NCGR_PEP_ID=MMETSP1380-20130617/17489_1 /TAXON_ID=5936 /ORGANISM="Euplotes crassus, Strain CT5" /LENGTH=52 /DNA_ID=CAMNT_0042422653 /DNA_START=78 /DNA_END=236 /DNA_ORIENTATION=-